jgi:16S rRNA (guanine527-N7)-methyltransferase
VSDRYEELRRVTGGVSRETCDALEWYEQEFRRWSQRINLAAPSTLSELWTRHILDSAQLMPLLGTATHVIDLGSGGGFPGAVLAILLRERPGSIVDLVESNAKKAAFLQASLARLDAPARVHRLRIEDAAIEGPEIVTARALAPLPLLLELSHRWLGSGAGGLFHKGRDYRQEVARSRDEWAFDLIEHPSRVDDEGRILEISKLRRRRDFEQDGTEQPK